jgi:hypothetical protein
VKAKTTEVLYQAGMNFGVRVAFDRGACTGAFEHRHDCGPVWQHYGYIVGCNIVGHGPYPTCPPYGNGNDPEGYCPITYPGAAWFSFPGPCPDLEFDRHCNQAATPGGYCKGEPNGTRACTWTYEDAGEVNIDELVGIAPKYSSHKEFCDKGCLEYVKYGEFKDRGKCTDWWNGKSDKTQNKQRMEKTDQMFKAKYPDMPSDSELPIKCDFDKAAFYKGLHK